MKIILTSILIVLVSISIFSQGGRRQMEPHKKIKQLEKVKLMETLDLEDETAVKFFGIRDKHQQNMTELREKSDKILDIMQETLSSDESTNKSSLNRIIEDYKKIEAEMSSERQRYLKEAENLLPVDQYARLLVFERNFRTEVRDLIMGQRMKRQGRSGNSD